MKLVEFTGYEKRPVAIPVDKITGIIQNGNSLNTFICTGASGSDSDNGWIVMESYQQVKEILESL